MDSAPPAALPAHQLICLGAIPWELTYRPDPQSTDAWQWLHRLGSTPAYCDVCGPAYLHVRRYAASGTRATYRTRAPAMRGPEARSAGPQGRAGIREWPA